MDSQALASMLKMALGGATILGIAFTGWNFYLQGKIREIAALWRWKDQFIEDYQNDRLAAVEKFATKSEVKDAFERLDHHLEEIRRSVDRLRDRLETKDHDA